MSSPSLIRLPSGDWLDPRAVRVIRVAPASHTVVDAVDLGRQPDRVLFDIDGGKTLVVAVESLTDAEAVRDQFARLINTARRNDSQENQHRPLISFDESLE